MTASPGEDHNQLAAMSRLVQVTCRLAGLQDLNEILHTVTDEVCRALACERASLFLYDEARHELWTVVATELEIAEIRTSADRGVTGWVATHRRCANIPHPESDPRWNASVDRETGFHTRNLLAAPVVTNDGRILGVLELMNRHHGTFDGFDEQLLQAFASHAANALERARLLDEARRSHEMRVSLDVGRRIQTSFLPRSLPEVPGYEIAAWWKPAEVVGGDYYDVLTLPDGRLGLVVADVSGHGVGPSLLMASARAMIRVLARTSSDPARIVSLLAETMAPDLQEGRFITFLMIALDPRTHQATYVNAGHGPALHFSRATGGCTVLRATGLPMGVTDHSQFRSGPPLTIEPGDLLLLATDGASEARNESGELFGRHRLEDLLRRWQDQPAACVVEKISEAILTFNAAEHPSDDVTLLVVERKLRRST